MKRTNDDTRLEEMLARRLRREPAAFDFDEWARRFPQEAKLAQRSFAGPDSHPRIRLPHIWRCIMESRYAKYAGAAAVLLVALAFLFPGRHSLVPESIALADVQKAIEEMQTGRATGTRNCFFGDTETPTYKLGVEKLFSVHYGYVDRTFTEDDRLIAEFTYHLPTGTVTLLFPTVRRYYRMEVPPEHREDAKKVTPQGFFTMLFASGDYRKLGPQEVQGIEAVGFEVSDLFERFVGGLGIGQNVARFFLAHGPETTRVWVNPKTRLPILVEAEGEVNPCLVTGFRKMRGTEINDRWEFEIQLDEAQFNPVIPEDYQELGLPVAAKAGGGLYCVGLASIPTVLLTTRRPGDRRR
jgi:hypothetical protein